MILSLLSVKSIIGFIVLAAILVVLTLIYVNERAKDIDGEEEKRNEKKKSEENGGE